MSLSRMLRSGISTSTVQRSSIILQTDTAQAPIAREVEYPLPSGLRPGLREPWRVCGLLHRKLVQPFNTTWGGLRGC